MAPTSANHPAILTPGNRSEYCSPSSDLNVDPEILNNAVAQETSDIASGPTLEPDQDFTVGDFEIQPQTSTQQQNVQQNLPDLEALRERDTLREELESAKSWNVEMEETLDYRQKELQRQEKKAVKAEQQLHVCKNELEKHKEEITRLQQDMERRTAQWKKKLGERQKGEQTALKQLGDARNHIFRLQPRRIDITETEAQELFGDLYNGIQRWVSNRLEGILDVLEEGQIQTRRYPVNVAKSFVALVSPRAMQSINCDQSDENIVTAVIMRFLCRSFFHRTFYCPLTTEGEQNDATVMLDHIEMLMRTVPRDGSQCRDWRVEALLALVQEPGFVERRTSHEHQKTTELTSILGPLVPNADVQELTVSIGRNMVRPAMDLAHRLQLAATVFSLEWTPFNDDLRAGHISSLTTDFSYFTSLNLTLYGKVVAAPSQADPGSGQDLKMTYLFDVAPGLYSRFSDAESSSNVKSICNPRVLVVTEDEGHGTPKEGPTLLRWIEEESRRENRQENGVLSVPISAGGADATKKQSKRKLPSFRLRRSNPAS